MSQISLTFIVLAACVITTTAQVLKPDAQQLRADDTQLAKLQKAFSGDFTNEFWLQSKEIADKTGPRIIHAMMERAVAWREEEGLIFVPLVALLDREPTLKLLAEYQKSERKSDQVWAREFITELKTEDTEQGVRAIPKKP